MLCQCLFHFFQFASCTVLLICLFFPNYMFTSLLLLFFLFFLFLLLLFFFSIFLGKGYELSGEIALKNNHYYYYLPRRHRSSRGVKRKKQNLHSFIVASFNAQ